MVSKMNILLVSADPILLSFLPRQLQEAGYQVTVTGETGVELKGILSQGQPDFVLADIAMPEFGGIELSLRIWKWSKVPVLLLTAWGAGENMVRGLDLVAESYLTEPFGVEGVVRRVESATRNNAVAASLNSYARSGSL
ncbi:response regulator transcription factor [Chloroflexota bacterium]